MTVFFKLLLIQALCLFLSCAAQPPRLPSDASRACAIDENYPPLFNVIENNSKQITIQLGNLNKFFNLSSKNYAYRVNLHETRKTGTADIIKPVQVAMGTVHENEDLIHVPITKTGIYEFLISKKENDEDFFWRQKVFAVAAKENTLTAEQEQQLAEKFAPLIQYHKDEKYSPVSFEYLLNEVEVNADLQEEPFSLKLNAMTKKNNFFSNFFNADYDLNLPFKFKNIRSVLPYYGHSGTVLKSGLDREFDTQLTRRYGENHKTVYYSVFENPADKEIYINYHFFYSFDPKNSVGDDYVMASHIFDRESIMVVVKQGLQYPISVIYGAHLPSQTMAYQDKNGKDIQTWQNGRILVNWKYALKNGNHPFAAAAKGSHGMYPLVGNFAVEINNHPMLREPAGGGRILYPENIEIKASLADSKPYKLKSLNLKNVTSNCMKATTNERNENNILAYSGDIVNVLGWENAQFPPFTERESNYFSYGDPNNSQAVFDDIVNGQLQKPIEY